MDDIHVPLLSPKTEVSVPDNHSTVCVPSDRQQHYENPSIYRVPAYITSLNPRAYQPKVVSFGPYHYGKAHLFPMEEHKRRVLGHFLGRPGKPPPHHFLESLTEVAQDLEDSYDMLDKGTRDQFLNLMIMDGVFMLEIMRTTVGKNRQFYEPNDPIFSIDRLKTITPYISRDMLLLENQLPMEVLYRLVKVEKNGEERIEYVNGLVIRFYDCSTKKIKKEAKCLDWLRIFRVSGAGDPDADPPSHGKGIKLGRCLHVLDVFRKCLLTEVQTEEPKDSENQQEVQTEDSENQQEVETEDSENQPEVETEDSENQQEVHIWSATELRETGVVFDKSNTNGLGDISFSRGRLRLPAVIVEDSTESKFLNAMTFERLHIGVERKVTSYVVFMDKIINNEQDVALLHTKGIIQNDIGSNEAVAELFNSLCKEVTYTSTHTLDDVRKEMSKYCEQDCNKWRAILSRTYFTSPWSSFSLVAAIFLFVLTIIQTVYAVLSYY